jgi:hypothetical protein
MHIYLEMPKTKEQFHVYLFTDNINSINKLLDQLNFSGCKFIEKSQFKTKNLQRFILTSPIDDNEEIGYFEHKIEDKALLTEIKELAERQ